jgi:dihydroneopterin aldolase
MSTIRQKIVYCVGDFTFDTAVEAAQHIHYVKLHAALVSHLEASNIYFRDTSASEVAEWIIKNLDAIKEAVEGDKP